MPLISCVDLPQLHKVLRYVQYNNCSCPAQLFLGRRGRRRRQAELELTNGSVGKITAVHAGLPTCLRGSLAYWHVSRTMHVLVTVVVGRPAHRHWVAMFRLLRVCTSELVMTRGPGRFSSSQDGPGWMEGLNRIDDKYAAQMILVLTEHENRGRGRQHQA